MNNQTHHPREDILSGRETLLRPVSTGLLWVVHFYWCCELGLLFIYLVPGLSQLRLISLISSRAVFFQGLQWLVDSCG